jgi:predicted ATPase
MTCPALLPERGMGCNVIPVVTRSAPPPANIRRSSGTKNLSIDLILRAVRHISSLFKLLNQIVEKRLRIYVAKSDGADTLLYFSRKITAELEIRLFFGKGTDKNSYQFTLTPTSSNRMVFSREAIAYNFQGDDLYELEIGEGHEETQLLQEAHKHPGQIAQYVLSDLKNWRVYHFHDTGESSPIKQTAQIGENDFLTADARNLAPFLLFLQSQKYTYYERIVSTIKLIAPFFDDFVLKPMPDNPNSIRLRWRDRMQGDLFDVSQMSDGTLRFICLTTLLLQPDPPSLIIIDEPELGLHPAAINLLAEMLHSAATRTQIIVSTQSVSLVNQFQPEDIIVVDRQDNQSTFRRLNAGELKHWLEDYSLGELWEMNVLGGRP